MAHIGAQAQPRRDHPPADGTLQAAQGEQRNETQLIASRNRPSPPEPRQRQRKRQPDPTRKQAVEPLPKINRLVLRQRHPRRAIDLGILGNGLVAGELGLPGGVVQRREDPRHRFPLGYRKPRFGQPGDPADHHDGDNQRGHRPQPTHQRGKAHRTAGGRCRRVAVLVQGQGLAC